MKRLTAALAAAALLCTGAAAEAPPAPEVSARSAVLMHADTVRKKRPGAHADSQHDQADDRPDCA